MDRIVFRPGDVRGGGNVISPSKGLADFDKHNCKLEKSTTTIDGQTVNTFKETYLSGSYFELDYTNWYDSSTDEFTVVGVLKKQSDDSILTNSNVRCIVNDTLFDTGTTDGSGEISFTIPASDEFLYQVKFVFEGTNSVAGCTGFAVVHIGDLDSIILRSQSNVVVEDESNWLCAELIGIDGHGNLIPVPYLDVEFLEEYEPGVRLRSSQKFLESGDSITLTAELYDVRDGSRVCLEDEIIEIYEEYNPGIKMYPSTSVTQSGDDPITLTAQLIDVDDGSNVHLSGESVEILEEYTPGIRVKADKLVIVKGESVSVSAQLFDAADGSLVMQDGELIEVGGEAGWAPDTVTVDLDVSSGSVDVGSNVTFTATVKNVNTPISGVTVTFKEGNSTLGTGTTNSSGVATYTTNSLSVGTHNVIAIYDVVESTNKSIIVNKLVPTLNLTATRKVLLYSVDTSKFTGTLTGNGIGTGKTVKLYRNNTLLDTFTTDSNGTFTYTTSASLDVGEHQFKAVYEGDSTYTSVTSQIITVSVVKYTPTITFTTSKDTVEVDESFTLSGTLSIGSGETVKLYENNVLLDTLTTGTGGAFTKTLSSSSSGAKTYKALYEGDNNHRATSATINVTVLNPFIPASISLTSSNGTISYYHGGSTLLSAVVRDTHDDLLPDVTVTFKIGDTVLGTDTTNGEGVATYTYPSRMNGDVTITASVDEIEDSVTIEDCIYWSQPEIYTYSTQTGDKSIIIDEDFTTALPENCEISMDVRSTMNGARFGLHSKSQCSSTTSNYGFGSQRSTDISQYYRAASTYSFSGITRDSEYHNFKFVKTGTNFKAYVDNTLKGDTTITWFDSYSDYTWIWWIWDIGQIRAKNIKIKPL